MSDWYKSPDQVKAEKYGAAAQAVRIKRDQIIAETDFYMLPDAPSAPAGLEKYRQALRDITEQAGFPHEVHWPVHPG